MNLFSSHRFHGAIAHIHDLRRMHDFDPAVGAAMFLEFRFDLRRVAHEKKPGDVRIGAQRHNCAGNKVRRTKIATHGVKRDSHRVGKFANLPQRMQNEKFNVGAALAPRQDNGKRIGALRPLPHLLRFDGEDLPALVIAAGRTGGV